MEDTTFNPILKPIPEQTDFKMEIYPMGKSKIFGALSKFQGKCTHPKKDTLVSYTFQGRTTKYLYATLDNCISQNQELLAECGLAVSQFPIVKGERVGLITILSHTDGEFLQNYYSMKPESEKAQAVGSVLTYLRRYSFCAALMLAAEFDDDAEKADGIKKDDGHPETTSYNKPTAKKKPEVKQLGFAKERTLTKNEINDKLKDCKTVPQQGNLWILLTKLQQGNEETIGWFSMRKAQIADELKELQKIVNKNSEKTNNEKGAEMFSPEPVAMKFVNAIRLLQNNEDLQVFNDMYTDAIMKLPAEQYKMVAMELDQLEAKFNEGK